MKLKDKTPNTNIMKRNLTIILLSLTCGFAFAQSKPDGNSTKDELQTNQAKNTINHLSGGGIAAHSSGGVGPTSGLFTIPIPPEELKGDFYLTRKFKMTSFFMKDGKAMDDMKAKYNIQSNLFVIEIESGEFRSMPGVVVERFEFNDALTGKKVYVNINKYPRNPLEYIGFYELLYDNDKVKLFSKTDTEIMKPTYNLALDIGERAPKVTYRTKFYLYDNEEIKVLKNFGKKSLEHFGSKKADVKKFIKAQKASFKKRADLIKVIDYYTSL